MGMMRSTLTAAIGAAAIGWVTLASAAPVVLANGVSTITLSLADATSGTTPMSIGYDPGFDQYYGGRGGNSSFSGIVWSGAGVSLGAQTPINVDIRGVNFNPNTGAIEIVTFNAVSGGSPSALMTMGRNGAGLFTGVNVAALATMPGLDGSQTVPAYDAGRNFFYSRNGSNDASLNVVKRTDGTLDGTIALNTAAAGSPNLQSEFVGFDSFFDVFIMIDTDSDRALVFDQAGAFLGASNTPNFNPTQGSFNAGYTNGQLFVFDSQVNAYRGYRIFESENGTPVPAPAIGPLILGLAIAAARLRRRR